MDSIHDKIDELYKKYESNEYMLNRLNNHITTILPNTLELENTNYNERQTRTNTLQTVQETFIRVFLNKNKYYYLCSSGLYYEYADNTYCVRKEDDIIHKLLTAISEDRTLMDWKYKTKFNIIRCIKDRNLLLSTPNTETIQQTINALHPTFFPSKNAVKYFLTVIGDNILKKQTNIRIIHKYANIFAIVDNLSALIGATNLTCNFVSKYNDNHTYSQYRLLQVNEQFNADMWYTTLSSLQLDLLCVAAHYSNRYGSSEQFIEENTDDYMKNHVLCFRNNTQDQIITQFIKHSTQPADESFCISWKQLHYIWKHFLSIHIMPNMMYSNSLKQQFIQLLHYDEQTDTFHHLTSKYLPTISHFLEFWSIHIILQNPGDEFTQELELSELCGLYGPSTMKDTDILKLVKHFYPEVVIVECKYNKYILQIECDLWNKKEGVNTFIESYKEKVTDIISIDDLYAEYITNTTPSIRIGGVSKQYFEKYILYKFKECIVYDTFINFHNL